MRRILPRAILLAFSIILFSGTERQIFLTDKSIPLTEKLEVFFPSSPAPAELELIQHLELKSINHPRVKFYLNYFTGAGRRTFQVWLKRSGLYQDFIQARLREHQLPESLFYLAMIESGLNPYARSRRGAGGIWQFMPHTARRYGLRVDFWVDERRDPEKSTLCAIAYLKDLYYRFGSWALALASYNAGEGKVSKIIERYDTDDYWELIQYPGLKKETRDFLPKMISACIIAENPTAFGFSPPQKNPLRYEKVVVSSPVDLRQVAKFTGVSLSELKRLNPALLRGITPPDSKYELNLPVGTAKKFLLAYKNLPREKLLTYFTYRVREGDTLWEICTRSGANLREVRELNHIYNPKSLRPGRVLIIPVPRSRAKSRPAPKPIAKQKLSSPPKGTVLVKYRVRSGDTLWEIARGAGVSVSELRKWNHYRTRLQLGEELVLYLTPKQRKEFFRWQRQRNKIARKEEKKVKRTYYVRKGDTLWEIARKYQVSPEELMSWNQLKHSSVIRPGDQLILFLPSNSGKQ